MEPLANLGLWGDGDEWFAISDAFGALGLKPPKEDAPTWLTIGDLWNSALRLQPELADSPEAWDDFRRALSEQTAVDWTRIAKETEFVDGRGGHPFTRMVTWIRERLAGNLA